MSTTLGKNHCAGPDILCPEGSGAVRWVQCTREARTGGREAAFVQVGEGARIQGQASLKRQVTKGAPRTRGDGPEARDSLRKMSSCSPHARGWSHRVRGVVAGGLVLPARAGMVPRHRRDPTPRGRAPRTCGDGPGDSVDDLWSQMCSPHARGWSRPPPMVRFAGKVLPARAGMVPAARATRTWSRRAPRTCGGIPTRLTDGETLLESSPRMRGCSRMASGGSCTTPVVPARGDSPAGLSLRPPGRRCSPRAGMVLPPGRR